MRLIAIVLTLAGFILQADTTTPDLTRLEKEHLALSRTSEALSEKRSEVKASVRFIEAYKNSPNRESLLEADPKEKLFSTKMSLELAKMLDRTPATKEQWDNIDEQCLFVCLNKADVYTTILGITKGMLTGATFSESETKKKCDEMLVSINTELEQLKLLREKQSLDDFFKWATTK